MTPQFFVGSRACAANHYVIAGKCPYGIYLCMSTSSTDCRLSEQVSITRSLYLSENVVKHTELLKKTFLVYKERAFVFTTIWRLFDKYRRVKLKVSAILSLK